MNSLINIRFEKPSLNEIVEMMDCYFQESKEIFEDYLDYHEDMQKDSEQLTSFVKGILKVDQTRKLDNNKVNALKNSYDVLFRNAISLMDAELYFDVFYSMFYEVPEALMEISDISIQQNSIYKQLTESVSQNILIDRSPSLKAPCFFSLLC